jgi:hypothetical protein
MDFQTVKDAETFNSNKGINLAADNNGHGTYGAEKVKFKVPGNNKPYVEVTADQLDFADLGYAGFKDVTSMIDPENPNGVYTVADIKAHQGTEKSHGNYAGWSLVVIYKNPDEKLRNISLFDGYATITSSYKKDLILDGFLTPSHSPINSRISYFTMDGDNGDNNLYITNEDGEVTDVKDPNHPGDAIFNATIEGINNRNPDVPSARMDLDVIELDDVLGPNNTKAKLQPRSGGDRYTPSFFIISTELYEPRVCYYIDKIYDNQQNVIFEDKHFTGSVESGKKYNFDIWISNMKKSLTDPDLETARLVQVYMETNNFDYTQNSTSIQNIGESTKIHKTDTKDGDTAEYSDDTATWRVGDDANGDHGGTLEPAENFNDDAKKVYVSFNGSLEVDEDTDNIDLTDFLDFKASFQTDSITIGEDNAQEIAQCQDLNVSGSVSAPPVGAFNIVQTSFHDSYDPADINDANYQADNALPTQVSSRDFYVKILSLQNDNENFKIYNGDVNVSIIATPNYQDGDDAGNQILCDNAQPLNVPQTFTLHSFQKDVVIHNIDGAIKNASFKITYNLNDVTPKHVCSRDVFAIRPERFDLIAPSSNDIALLKSGRDYNLTLKALRYNSTQPTQGYTISNVNSSIFDVVGDKYNPDNTLNNSLNGTLTFASSSFDIVNGVSKDDQGNTEVVGIAFDDVAKVQMALKDTTWAQVDIDNGDTPQDCSANGAYICGDINATFIPDHFTLSANSVNNSGTNYTYISNDLNISASLETTVSAKNSHDNVTLNFDKDSWESDLTVSFDGADVNGMTLNKNEIDNAVKLGFAHGVYTISKDETNSSKSLGFNYTRANNNSVNPFNVHGSDISVTAQAHYVANSGNTADITGSSVSAQDVTFVYGRVHTPRQRITGSAAEVNLFYEVYCSGSSCDKALLPSGATSKTTDDPRWFINANHTSSEGIINSVEQKGSNTHITASSLDVSTVPATVALTYDEERGYPYKATMEINASAWLIYNKYDASKTTNEFEVEYNNDDHSWAGKYETDTTTKQNAKDSINRRVMW